ncbi:MAG: tyrosine-type recombinase/integrase [Nitrococcus sp.]|nr:tyrosine-type recombinase/integrase [Nitrococcus sp.]
MNTLRQAAQEYLAMRRALGFKLQGSGKYLLDFVTFMEQRQAWRITLPLALAWARQHPRVHSEAWAARRLSIVRVFARYRSATDPRTEIPPAGLLPFRPQRARPYLYSDKEIEQLLQTTLNMPLSARHRKRCALLPWVYYCLFGLLAVSGLRLGEARNLELRDVDLKTGVLTIRGAKFGKDRLVPLHASTCKVLAEYLARRERHWAGRAVSAYLLVSSWGNRLDSAQIHRAFYAASRRIGLRAATDRHGPRLHDLRHRFATATLVNWYRTGEDVERRLPLLSTFLGHVHIADTQWYLNGSPELMGEAMSRLERHWEQRP